MITGILLGMAINVVLLVLAVLVVRRAATSKQIEARCPYCDLLYTGDQEVDKVTHLLCIDRGQTEIADLRQRSLESKNKKFRSHVHHYVKVADQIPAGDSQFWHRSSGGGYLRHQADIYINGSPVSTIMGGSREANERYAQEKIILEKHKAGVL